MYCNTLKQITEIRTKLYSAGIDSLKYHSGLSSEQRKTTLRYFTQNGGILAAVHCLDQGVDIPRVDGAIILASSSNPREYIQRRGRILRSAPDKVLADLSDVVVTKADGRIALRSDIVRAREIAMFARNKDQVIADIDFLDVDDETQGDDAIETSED
jgi:superfamily II DNA or RNA helicase